MTAPTPEQMRALAVRMARRRSVTAFETEVIAALRAAADQLEAVQRMHHERDWRPLDGSYIGGTYCNHCRRPWPCSTYQLVTADTAPQAFADGGSITGGRYWAGTAPQEDRDE